MAVARASFAVLLFTCTFVIGVGTLEVGAAAQDIPTPQLTPGTERKAAAAADTPAQPTKPQTVELTVPKGSPLQVALDKEVQVKKVGQPIHARVVEPVYAFDHIVVPVGSEISGEVTKIETISGSKRTLAVLNADFSPQRKVEVNFNELVLADGKRLALHTSVTPGSGQVIDFVTAADTKEKKAVTDMPDESRLKFTSVTERRAECSPCLTNLAMKNGQIGQKWPFILHGVGEEPT